MVDNFPVIAALKKSSVLVLLKRSACNVSIPKDHPFQLVTINHCEFPSQAVFPRQIPRRERLGKRNSQ
jgi:hypothetical protein